MTYDDFIAERRRLNTIANDLYDADNFPGSKAWTACNDAERAVKEFSAQYPDHVAELKIRATAAKAARISTSPAIDTLGDRIARGVD